MAEVKVPAGEDRLNHRRARELGPLGFVDEYLQEGGPLTMLEQGQGRDAHEPHGRPVFPERLHVVALSIDITTQLLETLDAFFTQSAVDVAAWPGTADRAVTPQTRTRLERIRSRRAGLGEHRSG